MRTVLVLAPNISPYPGGAEVYISDLMKELIAFGWKVICVTENPPEYNTSPIEYLQASANIEKITSSKTVTWREMIFSLLDCMKEIESKKIDIIHANSIEASLLGKIISEHCNIPLVATIHEHKPEEKSFGMGRVKLLFERLQLDAIIAPSSFYYNRALEHNMKASNVYKVVHGIDIDRMSSFINQSNHVRSSTLKILFVGRVYSPKGLHILIEALGELKFSFHYSLSVVGPLTDVMYKNQLDNIISFYGMQDYITFHGPVSSQSVQEFMLTSDVMVVPSLEEGFGLSIVEANLLRLPVIASKAGGIKDIIKHNENGLLFEVGDVQDLTEKLHFFIENQADISTYVENAYIRAKRDFSSIRMAKETIEVYEHILEGAGKHERYNH